MAGRAQSFAVWWTGLEPQRHLASVSLSFVIGEMGGLEADVIHDRCGRRFRNFHLGGCFVLLRNRYTCALPILTSLVWGTAPFLAMEFLGSSFLPIHQPSGPECAPTSSHIFERAQQSMPDTAFPLGPSCGEPRLLPPPRPCWPPQEAGSWEFNKIPSPHDLGHCG